MEIKAPKRVSHTYTQMIQGKPEDIFPLYCPVEEVHWCEGWDPEVVYTESGANEPDCVFVTREDRMASFWYVTMFDLEKGQVEMIKLTPGVTVSKLEIFIEPVTAETTRAVITYAYTSLGPEGDKVLAQFTRENYETAMDAWEKAMNHYLKTGQMLTGLPRF